MAATRSRLCTGRNSTRSSSAMTAMATSTPNPPSSHGRLAPGRSLKNVETAAIQADGTQASWATSPPSQGTTGMITQATSPRTVATGAAGAARMFATTPYVGSVGVSRSNTGWQASCAAAGTAIISASGSGIQRDITRAAGAANRSRPAVAQTDRTKPKFLASQGSNTSSTVTARASTGKPLAGRPEAIAPRTSAAMTDARNTLGSGVTSTTNPVSTTSDATIRTVRRSPTSAPPYMTRPMITAQFAPDTAVKWLSADFFMAESSASGTALVSPIASPGKSFPPSPGNLTATERNPERSPSATRRIHGGARWTVAVPSRYSRKATSPAGSAGATVATTRSSVPIATGCGTEPNTRTGTDPSKPSPAIDPLVSVASKRVPPSGTVCVVVTVPRSTAPLSAAVTRISGHLPEVVTPALVSSNPARAAPRTSGNTGLERERDRVLITSSSTASAQHAVATQGRATGTSSAIASTAQAAAAGIASRASVVIP